MLPYVPDGERGRRPRARRRGRRRGDPEVRRHRPALRLGGRPPAGHAAGRHGDLRDPRQGLHDAPPGRAARTCAAPTPGSPPSRRSTTCSDLGVTAVELLPVHHIADESFLARARASRNYWGYTTIGYFAPHSGYAATGSRGEQVREFKGMVKALHQAGHRGDPRRRLQPHRRGQPPRPDAVASRASTTPPTTGSCPTTRATTWTSPAPATRSTRCTRSVLRLIMDSLRYWVIECHVDGFRFDLASALARELYDVDRLSAFFDIIHQDPVLSPGQADRRAVGRRPGRLPGRQLPGAVVGVERQSTATRCATSGAATTSVAATSPRASPARATSTPTTGATRSPRSTSSPPTTASRCATSSPTTTSTTRPTARTTATAPTTTAPGTAASRARPTTPGSSRCAPASSATS